MNIVMDIKETAKIPEGEIDFKALIWSKNPRGRTVYHYTLEVRLGKPVPPAPVLPILVTDESKVIPGKLLYENGTLFHGPAFPGRAAGAACQPGRTDHGMRAAKGGRGISKAVPGDHRQPVCV